jgi:hypothetical protein
MPPATLCAPLLAYTPASSSVSQPTATHWNLLLDGALVEACVVAEREMDAHVKYTALVALTRVLHEVARISALEDSAITPNDRVRSSRGFFGVDPLPGLLEPGWRHLATHLASLCIASLVQHATIDHTLDCRVQRLLVPLQV